MIHLRTFTDQRLAGLIAGHGRNSEFGTACALELSRREIELEQLAQAEAECLDDYDNNAGRWRDRR